MRYYPFYFQGYGILSILPSGIWDTIHFISMDMGYYLFYLQGYGLLSILLPWIWDTFNFTFRDIGYLGKLIMEVFATS